MKALSTRPAVLAAHRHPLRQVTFPHAAAGDGLDRQLRYAQGRARPGPRPCGAGVRGGGRAPSLLLSLAAFRRAALPLPSWAHRRTIAAGHTLLSLIHISEPTRRTPISY